MSRTTYLVAVEAHDQTGISELGAEEMARIIRDTIGEHAFSVAGPLPFRVFVRHGDEVAVAAGEIESVD